MLTEAQKRAIYAYRQRIKGTPQGEEYRLKQNEYAKISEKKRYETNEEHRLNKNKYNLENYYGKQYYSYDRMVKQFRNICV